MTAEGSVGRTLKNRTENPDGKCASSRQSSGQVAKSRNDSECVPRNEHLFVGWNYPQGDSGITLVKAPFAASRNCCVARFIQFDAQGIEISADSRANFRRILADSSRENDRIRSIQHREIRPHILSHSMTKEVNCKGSSSV